jgi:hypothetical protein
MAPQIEVQDAQVAIPITSFSYPMTWELPIHPFTYNPIIPSEQDVLYIDKLHDTKKELQIDKTSLKLTQLVSLFTYIDKNC